MSVLVFVSCDFELGRLRIQQEESTVSPAWGVGAYFLIQPFLSHSLYVFSPCLSYVYLSLSLFFLCFIFVLYFVLYLVYN